jgi:hypothetical protein
MDYNEWFKQITSFDRKQYEGEEDDEDFDEIKDENEESEDETDDCMSDNKFYKFLRVDGVNIRILTSPKYTSYVWCSNFDAYENNFDMPVLYIEAHYDIVCTNITDHQNLGDIVVANCYDNKVTCSCSIRCRTIHNDIFTNRRDEFITYIIFSNIEERGIGRMNEWFENHHIRHNREKYVVMDVSNDKQTNFNESNMCIGAYIFGGDAIQ